MSRELLALAQRLSDIEQRNSRVIRHGKVAEVNTAEGWVRLKLGDGVDGDFLSPRVPYAQIAGALKVHAPPSVGQNMTLFSAGGDYQQAVALPLSWNEANKSPGGGSDPVITFGGVKLTVTESGIRAEIGGFVIELSGAGLAMSGGGVGHNGVNIGSTHRHGGVERGGSNTDAPSGGGPSPS